MKTKTACMLALLTAVPILKSFGANNADSTDRHLDLVVGNHMGFNLSIPAKLGKLQCQYLIGWRADIANIQPDQNRPITTELIQGLRTTPVPVLKDFMSVYGGLGLFANNRRTIGGDAYIGLQGNFAKQDHANIFKRLTVGTFVESGLRHAVEFGGDYPQKNSFIFNAGLRVSL